MSREMYITHEYAAKTATYHVEHSPWKATQVLTMLAKQNIKPSSVCEIGCGAGEILHQIQLRTAATRLVGYEISPDAYNLCLRRTTDRLVFKLGDAFDDPERFDLCLIMDVLEHVEDLHEFLSRLHAKCQYAVLHIPLELSVQSVLRETPMLDSRKMCGHVHHFSKGLALAVLEGAGLEVVDWFYTNASAQTASDSLKRTLARYPRKIAFGLNKDLAVRILGGYSLLVLVKTKP